jgi:predicted O-linked N-acetylglucosamine transferase (SPINDLY family)
MSTLEAKLGVVAVDGGERSDDRFRRAVDHHFAGRLFEAERLYREVLAERPSHADANHNLGALAVATGRAAAGLPHFHAALRASPGHRQYWVSCVDCLIRCGQPDIGQSLLALGVRSGLSGEDVAALTERLRKASFFKDLGPLMSLFDQGRFAEGEPGARSLADRFPERGLAWQLLAGMLNGLGRAAEALAAMERAVGLLPGDAEAERNLGGALQGLGRDEEAEVRYRRALQLKPDYAEAWNSLAVALQKLGRADEAEACCRRALELRPGYADAGANLGILLHEQGRFDEAEASHRSALESAPERAEAWSNLGNTLQRLGRLEEAECVHRRAIELNGGLAEIHINFGSCLHLQGRLTEAEASFRAALELNPGRAAAWSNLGSALQALGRLHEAEAAHRRAVGLDPRNAKCRSALLFCLGHDGGIAPETLFAEHLRFGESFEAPLRAGWRPHSNSRDAGRRLRVGLVSADFCRHAMAPFLEPLVAALAENPGLSLRAYANNALEDAATERLRARIPQWVRIPGISDCALAETIRNDAVDVLIDLSGHTDGNRLLAFARKPAPIQIGWIGYLGTGGMGCMDYYLGDRYFLPFDGFNGQFTEAIANLPVVARFQPEETAPPVSVLPALAGGAFTFGSFNRLGKLGPEAVALWSRLLRALPNARMLIGGMVCDEGAERVAGWFGKEGIARDRLHFHRKAGMADYLQLHHRVDVCLDPFPYTGGATTGHALWMGVPTLTMAGSTVPGRLGAAMLQHVGLEGFVARDDDDFVERGLGWAGDLDALAELRGSLRERFLQSPLGQPAVFAEGLSAALREMWRRWCAGLPAGPLQV